MERREFLAGAAAGGAVLAAPAQAQAYPTRIITVVVPFGAGSGTDVTGRIVAHSLGPALGQNVIIENKVGATGMIAASAVAQSPPDGYTLLFATNSTHGSNPSLFKKITYDPVRDFAPVGRLGAFGYFVVVNAALPVRSIGELVAYAKANPDKLSYGSGSSTSYIMAETFKRGTGAPILRVPYRSNPAALTDLVAGRITVMFADISSSVAFVKSGELRALAVTSLNRSAIVPPLPWPAMKTRSVRGVSLSRRRSSGRASATSGLRWAACSQVAPRSNGAPSTVMVWARPPMRAAASTRVTATPAARSRRVAASPATPAPTTTTPSARSSPTTPGKPA